MNKTVAFLRKKEWSMGNGQCNECCGNEPGKWAPHPCVPTKEHEGHYPPCPLAEALKELEESVIYRTLDTDGRPFSQ